MKNSWRLTSFQGARRKTGHVSLNLCRHLWEVELGPGKEAHILISRTYDDVMLHEKGKLRLQIIGSTLASLNRKGFVTEY